MKKIEQTQKKKAKINEAFFKDLQRLLKKHKVSIVQNEYPLMLQDDEGDTLCEFKGDIDHDSIADWVHE